MKIRWVEFEPKVAPGDECASLISSFRPEIGNQRHIDLSRDYGVLLDMYREIAVREERIARQRSRRRFTVAEAEAEALEKRIVEQLKELKQAMPPAAL